MAVLLIHSAMVTVLCFAQRRGLSSLDYAMPKRRSSSTISSAVRRKRKNKAVPQYLLRPRMVKNLFPKRLVCACITHGASP